MKKLIYVILVLISHVAYPQQVPQKIATQFDAFIMKNAVEWASYNNDTIRFTSNNLHKILVDRFEKDEIKISLPVTARTTAADKINYATKQEVTTFYPSTQSQTPDQYFDSSANNLLGVVEILFIEKGKLQSYIPWVSPKFSVITQAGIWLGYAEYFSSCFNYKNHFSPSSPGNIISLGQTKRKIKPDSIPSINMLKELYGKNMVETLWPYVINNRLDIYDVENNQQLHVADLNSKYIYDPVSVPVYDSTGKRIGSQQLSPEPLSPGIFTTVELVQDWFYDTKKNIVYNTITELVLYAKTEKGIEEDATGKALFKIVFK